MIEINISRDFSNTPGPRYMKDGKFSGEEFRNTILKPKFIEAKKSGEKITVILDGCYGFPPSFLEESFGGLAREFEIKDVLSIFDFVSDEEPLLIERIKKFIEKARDEK